MPRTGRRTLSFVLITLVCASMSWAATGVDADAIRRILKDRVDNYETSVGLVVGIIDPDGRQIIGYGRTVKGGDREPDGDTLFEIGSMTKVFTAILLADLVARGKIKLDDPAGGRMHDGVTMPSRDDREITFLDLATHHSGLPRLPDNLAPADAQNPYADYSEKMLHEFLNGYALPREIGSTFEYSNLAVGLLGHLLALRAEMDFEELLAKRITGPLGMKDTMIELTPEARGRMATGHARGTPVPDWDLPTLAGAGAIRSTVNDILTFLSANMGLVETDLAGAMADSHTARADAGPNMRIGLAWLIASEHGGPIVWHNGGTGGFQSFAGFDTETRRGVVVLSNQSADVNDIGFHLLRPAYELAKLQAPKTAIAIEASTLDDYVGEYDLAPGFVMSVTRQGDELYVQLTGQPAWPVFPHAEDEFFYKVVDAQLTFGRDEAGKVDHLVLHQGGADQRADRRAPDDAGVQEVEVSAEILKDYVGKYELAPGFVLTVTLEDGRLMTQATGQQKIEIFASSETEFFLKVVPARLEFHRSEDGTVEKLVLFQNGQEVPGKRID